MGKYLQSDLSPILPELELFWDFMLIQVICNFHKDPVKTKQAMLRTRSYTRGFGTKG